MIDYQILLERLPQNPLPGLTPPADAWETIVLVPLQKDARVDESDVIKFKEQVAMQVVFGKTPARVRVAWQEKSRGKIGGKQIDVPREVYFFDNFTFFDAQQFLITQLEAALQRVKDEKAE